MTSDEERLVSGQAWDDFCDRLRSVGRSILAEGFPVDRFPIDSLDAGDEPCGIDEMSCPPRVDHEPRVGKRLHHRTRAAGVVQMDVCGYDVGDLFGCDVALFQYRQDPRNRVRRSAIDDGHPISTFDQVAGSQSWSAVSGVDACDTVA